MYNNQAKVYKVLAYGGVLLSQVCGCTEVINLYMFLNLCLLQGRG